MYNVAREPYMYTDNTEFCSDVVTVIHKLKKKCHVVSFLHLQGLH